MMGRAAEQAVNTRAPRRFDLPFDSAPAQRQRILQSRIAAQPRYRPVGGTAASNPFKDSYDLMRAEGRAEIARLERSWLWSPAFRPSDFRRFVLYPLLGIAAFCVLTAQVGMYRRRLQLRRRGFGLPDSEERLRARGWLPEHYHDELYGELFRLVAPAAPAPASPDRLEALSELERAQPHRAQLQRQLDALTAARRPPPTEPRLLAAPKD